MNLENLDLTNVQNPYFNNNKTNLEIPQVYDYNAFNNNVIKNDIINVKEEEEKDLKYNKYIYEYNMSNSARNTQNLEGLNNLASLGINLVGSLIDTATPIVQDLSNKMKEFEDKVNEDFSKRQTCNSEGLSKKPIFYKNEDEDYLYFVVELPRVRKEDCEIKFLKSENSIQVFAKTEPNVDGFSFVENKDIELKLKIPEGISITGNSIEANHRNGALYISITKSLINLNNININILS